ncbi:glycosyltransferase family 25 protein [Synechocystis salina LEGE 06155]|nr:glycosyltransferase family 25 protein [Synechocystis salina LEGE 06155]
MASAFFNYFAGTYIINLADRGDRRQEMTREFRRFQILGLPEKAEFFTAVKPSDKGNFPSLGARGCFLSHLGVLKAAKAQNLEHVLLLEDDATFTKNLVQHQNQLLRELQTNSWDLVYFGHQAEPKNNANSLLQSHHEPIVQAHFLAVHSRIFDQLIDFLETLLERPGGHPDGGPMHVDGAYSTFRQQNPHINTLVATTPLGFQRASRSSIASRQWFDRLPAATNMVNLARKAKNFYHNVAV